MAVTLDRGKSATALRLTPLIDVMFMLVIFFLVTTRFEQEERDMDVNLAQASEAQPTIFDGEEVYVTLTPAGDYYVDGEQLDAMALEEKLQAFQSRNPGRQRVSIRADQNSRSGQLIAAINACNRANISNYTIAAE